MIGSDDFQMLLMCVKLTRIEIIQLSITKVKGGKCGQYIRDFARQQVRLVSFL